MKITEKNFDIQTGLETIIEREMTNDELAQWETDQAKIKAKQEAIEAAKATETARQALLDKLGITADEAKLLLG